MTMAATAGSGARTGGMTAEERKVIFASSLGTVFEWYDFYIYGTLGVFLAKYFFANVPPNVGFIFALLAFAAGFAVRPSRRHDRPQIHLPHHHDVHGRRHLLHRPAAELRELGHRRADRADPASP